MKNFYNTKIVSLFFLLLLGVFFNIEKAQASIAQVAGQNKGQNPCGVLGTLAYASNVTAGNQIIINLGYYRSGSGPVAGTPAKSAGTATIGAFAHDASYASNSGASFFENDVYRASVTGTGS